jgi:hypothetical protein
MTTNPGAGAGGTIPPSLAADPEFQLAWLRTVKASEYVGKLTTMITLIAGLISLTVVVSVILFAVMGIVKDRPIEAPEVLSNWGGIILGFYFGQFVYLLKDFTGIIGGSSSPSATRPPP